MGSSADTSRLSHQSGRGVSVIGCAVAAVLVVGAICGIAALLGVFWRLLKFGGGAVIFAVVAIATIAGVKLVRDSWAASTFRKRHLGTGRDILVVYSDSPHWGRYIEQHWLQRWADRAVTLNRSAPGWDAKPEATLWRRFAGDREHTP